MEIGGNRWKSVEIRMGNPTKLSSRLRTVLGDRPASRARYRGQAVVLGPTDGAALRSFGFRDQN